MLALAGEALPLYIISRDIYSVRYLMKGTLQSSLGLGTVATICSMGGTSSMTYCPCLMDGVTRSWMNTPAGTSTQVDPNFDNSSAHDGIQHHRICLELPHLSAVSVHLLTGAASIFIELVDYECRVTVHHEAFKAELYSYMETM
jgi:hypothetical protein